LRAVKSTCPIVYELEFSWPPRIGALCTSHLFEGAFAESER